MRDLESNADADDQEEEGGGENQKQKIVEQYQAAKAKEQAIRLKIAKKNREISTLKRKLDEVPSRNELSQYQKRFIELYNQSKIQIFSFKVKLRKKNFWLILFLIFSVWVLHANQTVLFVVQFARGQTNAHE